MPVTPAMWEGKGSWIMIGQPRQKVKRARSMAKVLECLPSKCKVPPKRNKRKLQHYKNYQITKEHRKSFFFRKEQRMAIL
jgi:hypothetical protein